MISSFLDSVVVEAALYWPNNEGRFYESSTGEMVYNEGLEKEIRVCSQRRKQGI
jgi:hypothetical protein